MKFGELLITFLLAGLLGYGVVEFTGKKELFDFAFMVFFIARLNRKVVELRAKLEQPIKENEED